MICYLQDVTFLVCDACRSPGGASEFYVPEGTSTKLRLRLEASEAGWQPRPQPAGPAPGGDVLDICPLCLAEGR